MSKKRAALIVRQKFGGAAGSLSRSQLLQAPRGAAFCRRPLVVRAMTQDET
jgi:hypothetical protein